MKLLFVSIFYFLLRSSNSDPINSPIAVRSTTPGFRHLGVEPRPQVLLEIFIDLNCPDSLAGWPIVKDVQAHYGNDVVDLVLQQVPLPYHRNGFLSSQGLFVIRDEAPDFIFEYTETILANYQDFLTANTVNKTETEVLEHLAFLAFVSTEIDQNLFISQIGTKRAETVAVWKYAAKRHAAGTPTFFVNGVDIGLAAGISVPSFDDWITFLDPIVFNTQ